MLLSIPETDYHVVKERSDMHVVGLDMTSAVDFRTFVVFFFLVSKQKHFYSVLVEFN